MALQSPQLALPSPSQPSRTCELGGLESKFIENSKWFHIAGRDCSGAIGSKRGPCCAMAILVQSPREPRPSTWHAPTLQLALIPCPHKPTPLPWQAPTRHLALIPSPRKQRRSSPRYREAATWANSNICCIHLSSKGVNLKKVLDVLQLRLSFLHQPWFPHSFPLWRQMLRFCSKDPG